MTFVRIVSLLVCLVGANAALTDSCVIFSKDDLTSIHNKLNRKRGTSSVECHGKGIKGHSWISIAPPQGTIIPPCFEMDYAMCKVGLKTDCDDDIDQYHSDFIEAGCGVLEHHIQPLFDLPRCITRKIVGFLESELETSADLDGELKKFKSEKISRLQELEDLVSKQIDPWFTQHRFSLAIEAQHSLVQNDPLDRLKMKVESASKQLFKTEIEYISWDNYKTTQGVGFVAMVVDKNPEVVSSCFDDEKYFMALKCYPGMYQALGFPFTGSEKDVASKSGKICGRHKTGKKIKSHPALIRAAMLEIIPNFPHHWDEKSGPWQWAAALTKRLFSTSTVPTECNNPSGTGICWLFPVCVRGQLTAWRAQKKY